MPLTKTQIKFLKQHTHALNPIIWLGQKGLTDKVLEETEQALEFHELVKCKISIDDKEERAKAIATIAKRCHCECVQKIGKTAVFYRQNKKQDKLSLPK
jgi:RNA-binding protein